MTPSSLTESAEVHPLASPDGVSAAGPDALRARDLAASLETLQESILQDVQTAPERPLAVLEAKIQQLEQTRLNGALRESRAGDELAAQYPASEGYAVYSERVLRHADGPVALDPETGSFRRVDYCVVRDGQVVDSVEVTSLYVDKTDQLAKGARILESGGTYIRLGADPDAPLAPYAAGVSTRVLRYP